MVWVVVGPLCIAAAISKANHRLLAAVTGKGTT